MQKIFFLLLLSSFVFAKEYTLNFIGDIPKETFSVTINFEVDQDGKPLKEQKYDVRNLPSLKSLKVLSAPGLLGTLKDEREFIAYYKTDLEVGGLKIRNLYKTAVARVYGDESNISLTFDTDHYQNIISFLRYHNIKQEVIKDIDNLYGTWEEIE